MRTVRRLLYRDIVWSVVFVAIAFLSLFFFIDVVSELEDVGRGGYTLGRALLHVLLAVPGHFYELFPIAVLIGTIYAMARLAQSSEFTILRTAGLGPGRALRLLALPGLLFALLTFAIGDWVVPLTERQAEGVKAGARGIVIAGGGAWLKERRDDSGTVPPAGVPDPMRAVSVNVAAAVGAGELRGVQIFEFDREGRLRTRIDAEQATVLQDGHWLLRQVRRSEWPTPDMARDGVALRSTVLPELRWATTLESAVVAAALLPARTMSVVDLWRYTHHLSSQDQAVQRHEIQFWKKALYPLACVVMVALALPFAYLHARAGGVSFKVFGGIMLGISFVLLNNAAGHLGQLRDWTPWVAAAAPGLLYLLISMGAFAWLVRYR